MGKLFRIYSNDLRLRVSIYEERGADNNLPDCTPFPRYSCPVDPPVPPDTRRHVDDHCYIWQSPYFFAVLLRFVLLKLVNVFVPRSIFSIVIGRVLFVSGGRKNYMSLHFIGWWIYFYSLGEFCFCFDISFEILHFFFLD